MITNQNLILIRGDSPRLQVTLQTANGEPYAYTGETIRYRIARNAHSPDSQAYVTKTAGSGGMSVTPEGVVTIDLSAAETAAFDLGLYSHAIVVSQPPADHFTAMTGTIRVRS